MKHYETRNVDGLSEIIDRVHDRYFNIDEIVFDESQQVLRIPLCVIAEEAVASRAILLIKVRTHPVCAATLAIHTVKKFEVIDEAKTGQGNINTIAMEGDSVVIKCGLPVTIKAKVSEFHIDLDTTDQILGYKRYYSFM